MRLLMLGLFLASLCGCQSVEAAPEKSDSGSRHPFELTERIETALAESADELALLSKKVDQTHDMLAELIEQGKLNAGQQCDIAKAIGELKPVEPPPQPRSAGEAADPPTIPESEVLQPGGETSITDSKGVQWNLSDFIARYYNGPWTYPGDIDSHLASHGVNIDGDLSHDTKEKLHAAIHEREKSGTSSGAALAMGTPINLGTGNCPDGLCPLRSRSVTVQTPTYSRSVNSQTYAAPVASGQVYSSSMARTRLFNFSGSRRRCNGRRCR